MVCAVWSWIGCVVYELRMFLEKSGLKQSYGYKSHKQLNYKGDDGIPECNGGSREEGISVKSHMWRNACVVEIGSAAALQIFGDSVTPPPG